MNCLAKLVRDLILLFTGLLITKLLLIFLLLSIPVYIYRWIICKIVAPCFHPGIGKAVTSSGVSFGHDYASKDFYKHPSRSTLVTSIVIEGAAPLPLVFGYLEENWLAAEIYVDSSRRRKTLQYPELRQYVESWMGFLFWKKDPQFDLKNHVKLHKIDESCTDEEAEQFFSELTETVMNTPFTPKRSPWEVYVVQGYRNDKLNKASQAYINGGGDGGGGDGGIMTVFIFKVHHVLTDGYSLMSLISEDNALRPPLSPTAMKKIQSEMKPKENILKRTLSWILLPAKLFYDLGAASINDLKPQVDSPWHIQDNKKQWRSLIGRSELIPVERIAFVKNKLGVSFTSVLFSCMSAALSKILEGKLGARTERFKRKVKYLPVATTLPLTNQPRQKMRNRLTASVVDVPIRQNLSPMERLIQCEKCFYEAKEKILPYVIPYLVKAVGSHLAVVARLLLYNRGISSGLSNFPGPRTPIEIGGRKILSAGFAFSNMPGVAGIGFQIISYSGFLQFVATVENGVMGRDELTQLLDDVCQELNNLYDLAVKENNKSAILEMPDE